MSRRKVSSLEVRRALESPAARPLARLDLETVRAYKVFRVRADGSLGPLFVGARARVPQFEWVECDSNLSPPAWISKSRRPGWHAKTSLRAARELARGGPARAIFEVYLAEVSAHRKKSLMLGRWLWVGRRIS